MRLANGMDVLLPQPRISSPGNGHFGLPDYFNQPQHLSISHKPDMGFVLAYDTHAKFSGYGILTGNIKECNAKSLDNFYQEGRLKEALDCLDSQGITLDSVAYGSLIKTCGERKDFLMGRLVHDHVNGSGLGQLLFLRNRLIEMYGKCGRLDEAVLVFEQTRNKNLFSWTAMIRAYVRHRDQRKAIRLFHVMLQQGIKLDKVLLITVLQACNSAEDLVEGQKIHKLVIENGIESDVVLDTALLNMYSKCGSLKDAWRVFNSMRVRNTVSWNSMITAFAQHGHGKEALDLFRQMQLQNVRPTEITLVGVLNACGSLGAVAKGKLIHACIIGDDYESNFVLMNALIDMCGKCGMLDIARRMFDSLQCKNVITWTSMITSYAQYGNGKQALELYQEMEGQGARPDEVTFSTILVACANLGSLSQGRTIHNRIMEFGFETDILVANALVHMYGKCGNLGEADMLFSNLRKRDVATWTAMIATYAQHGYGEKALLLFDRMLQEGVRPDQVVFLSVLSSCSYMGLVDKGCHYFSSLSKDHMMTHMTEYYECVVDMLGRSGWFDEAEDFIMKMPFQPKSSAWKALLTACKIAGNVKWGEIAAEHVFSLDPEDSFGYAVLSNIYYRAGRWLDAARVKKMMEDRGIKEDMACSSIEVDNHVYEFVDGFSSHVKFDEIYTMMKKLSVILKETGYSPISRISNADGIENDHLICYHHSEQLAIAFGLARTPHMTPLRVVKNLPLCPDCHSASKCISTIFMREIFMRGGTQFHHFKDGKCSCRDYF